MPSSVTIDGIEFTRFIQASFKIKAGNMVIYVDPHRLTEKEVGNDKADLILITHPHGDHMDPRAIQACAKPNITIVTNPAVQAQLPDNIKKDYKIVAIKAGESTTQRGTLIKAVEGYNQYHPREQGYNTGFTFSVQGRAVFHAGDTGKVPELAQAAQAHIALVPIGGTYTMDEAEAADAVKNLLKPKVAIPMHYGYATGGDPEKFKKLLEPGVRVEVLEPVIKASLSR